MAAPPPATAATGKPAPPREGRGGAEARAGDVEETGETVSVAVADPHGTVCEPEVTGGPEVTGEPEVLDELDLMAVPSATALTACGPGKVPLGIPNVPRKLTLSSRGKEMFRPSKFRRRPSNVKETDPRRMIELQGKPDPETVTRVPGIPEDGLSVTVCANAGLAVVIAQVANASTPLTKTSAIRVHTQSADRTNQDDGISKATWS